MPLHPPALLQLAGLSALHTLVLQSCDHHPDGYAALQRLPCLRRLHVFDIGDISRQLSRLTGLEELLLCDVDAEAEALNAALGELTSLTSL